MRTNPITALLSSFGITRDGWALFFAKWSSVVVGLAALGTDITKFGLPASWQPKLLLASFIIGIISANHQSSQLDSTSEKTEGAGVGSVTTRAWLLPVAFLLGTAAFAGSTAACFHKPPALSPAASLDYDRIEITRTIDLLRDVAIRLNAQTPPLLSTATTRLVVNYHTLAVQTMDAAPNWKQEILIALGRLSKDPSLLPAELVKLHPYFDLVQSVVGSYNKPPTPRAFIAPAAATPRS